MVGAVDGRKFNSVKVKGSRRIMDSRITITQKYIAESTGSHFLDSHLQQSFHYDRQLNAGLGRPTPKSLSVVRLV